MEKVTDLFAQKKFLSYWYYLLSYNSEYKSALKFKSDSGCVLLASVWNYSPDYSLKLHITWSNHLLIAVIRYSAGGQQIITCMEKTVKQTIYLQLFQLRETIKYSWRQFLDLVPRKEPAIYFKTIVTLNFELYNILSVLLKCYSNEIFVCEIFA